MCAVQPIPTLQGINRNRYSVTFFSITKSIFVTILGKKRLHHKNVNRCIIRRYVIAALSLDTLHCLAEQDRNRFRLRFKVEANHYLLHGEKKIKSVHITERLCRAK
jgi:hypothetical protein